MTKNIPRQPSGELESSYNHNKYAIEDIDIKVQEKNGKHL